MRTILLISLVFLLIAQLSCTKEEVLPREYSRIKSLGVVEIKSTGCVFQGEIFYLAPGTAEFGFVWSDAGFPTIENGEKMSSGIPTRTAKYDTPLVTKITVGKTYTMRAYAISNGYVVYGDAIDFVLEK